MQIVYISNRPDIFRLTYPYVEAFMRFVDRVLVFCPADRIAGFRAISSRLTVIDETELLKEHLAEFRASGDHQKTNYMLRTMLPRHEAVAPEFIMSDDDYRPLVPIDESYYRRHGKHRLFYFYAAERWDSVISRKHPTSYDLGILNALKALRDQSLTTFVFSSHMPQICDREILRASAEFFAPLIPKFGILPEWETYGNFALSRFPGRFDAPRPFRVMGWPDLPHWPWYVPPAAFDFENFYPEAYGPGGMFAGLPVAYDPATHRTMTEEKIRRHAVAFARIGAEKLRKATRRQRRRLALPRAVRDFLRGLHGRPRAAGVKVDPETAGFSIAGLFGLPSGLGHAATMLHRTLAESLADRAPTCAVDRIDITSFFFGDRRVASQRPLRKSRGRTIVLCVNPPQGAHFLRHLPRAARTGNRVVGYWWWEFPSFPEEWRPFVAAFDEVWVSSRFLEEAWRPLLPVPVRWVPLDLRHVGHRADFNLPRADGEPIRLLSILNLGSTLSRKNVAGSIAVLRKLRAAGLDAALTIKLGGVTAHPERYLDFLKLDPDDASIDVLVSPLSDDEVTRLIDRHDIYLSLHRAEGLGISLAQSMWRRKVVVASRWSGNLDYMSEDTSLLVDVAPTSILDENGNSREPQLCAEPDVDDAVRRILEVVVSRAGMEERGRRAHLRIIEVGEAAVAHNARQFGGAGAAIQRPPGGSSA